MSETPSTLNLVDLIDRLEPVPEPAVTIALWPQTAGWLWVLSVVIGLGFLALRYGLQKRRANAYRREALRDLASCGSDPTAIARVVRRTALAGFGRARVASLHGEAWLAFLDRSYGGIGFRDGPGSLLASAPYRRSSASDGLADVAADWIRYHRTDLQ